MVCPDNIFIRIKSVGGFKTISLEGSWTVENLSHIALEIKKVERNSFSVNQLVVTTEKIIDIDLNGARVFIDFIEGLKSKGLVVKTQLDNRVNQYVDLALKFEMSADVNSSSSRPIYLVKLEALGDKVCEVYALAVAMLSFLGELIVSCLKLFTHLDLFRGRSFIKNLGVVGVGALPIVGLISFLIGIVLAYQGITQLARFGAQIYTVNLLGLGVLREIGVLLTSVVIAGRSGSAFTAELGMMVVNEEVNALKVMGLSPFYLLIIPKIMALTIALPLLTFFSDIMALIGGALMMKWLLHTDYRQFISQFLASVNPGAFWVGIVKAPFFGFIIGFVGCFEGMQVRGSAQSVGYHTTKSVVEGIFLVIILDAMFSVLFAYLGI